jgi:lysyl-tRNA synthetase-like protein
VSAPAPRATPPQTRPPVEPIEPLPAPARAPRVLALAMMAVAILGIVSSLTPRLRSRADLLNPIVPGAVQDVAAAATLALSVMLLILAGGLRRRKHRAWQLSVVALAGVALFHVAKGLDVEESVLSIALLGALIVYRSSFDIEGDPETPYTFLRHALAAVAGLILLGVFLIETQSMLSGDSLPLVQALGDLARSAIGLETGHLTGHGARRAGRARRLRDRRRRLAAPALAQAARAVRPPARARPGGRDAPRARARRGLARLLRAPARQGLLLLGGPRALHRLPGLRRRRDDLGRPDRRSVRRPGALA